LKDTNKGI